MGKKTRCQFRLNISRFEVRNFRKTITNVSENAEHPGSGEFAKSGEGGKAENIIIMQIKICQLSVKFEFPPSRKI